MKFYLNQSACLSYQKTFDEQFLQEDFVAQSSENRLANEPDYKPYIPLNSLRRMGKTSRMGIATGLNVVQETKVAFDSIICGSAYGSNAESFKFLDQIFQFNEGAMTPTNFVQSTTNVIASQLAMMTENYGYNSTNCSKAHSFENSLLEAITVLENNIGKHVLLGAVDEISVYTERLFGFMKWLREDAQSFEGALKTKGNGFVLGEGAAYFSVSGKPLSKDAVELTYFNLFTNKNAKFLREELLNLPVVPDLILNPKNGDVQTDAFVDEVLADYQQIPQIEFKKYFGEFPTVSALSLWFGQKILEKQLTQFDGSVWSKKPQHILLFNHFVTQQASFILLSRS